MKGRKPIPKEIAKIRGYYRPNRHKDILAVSGIDFVYGGIPEPPTNMRNYATKIWYEQLSQASKIDGYLAEIDLPLFEMYCNVYADLMETKDILKKEPMQYKDANGVIRVNPLYNIQMALSKEFTTLSNEFGFSPSARTRIKLQPTKQQEQPTDDYQL